MKPEETDLDILAFDDQDNYVKLGQIFIDDQSGKAVLATWWFDGNEDFRTEWLPKSQLRIDEEGDCWMSRWLFENKLLVAE